MSQRVFIKSVSRRYGVDTVSGLPASQSHIFVLGRKGSWSVTFRSERRLEVWICVSSMTRSDIENVGTAVARQPRAPAERHWRAVRKIISYMNEIQITGWGLFEGGDLKLSVYVDANYADKANGRRSTSGVAAMLLITAVIAISTRQQWLTFLRARPST